MRGRSVRLSLLFVVTPFIMLACSSDGGTTTPPPATVTVTFSSPAPTISQGDTVSVAATASNGSAVAYATSSATTATVSPSGLVTGVGAGSATITASSGAASATLDVTVNALTPSVEIGQITQNGQPVDENNVAGTVLVSVTAEVGNAFDGEVAIFAGTLELGSAPLSGAGGGALVAALDGVGSATVGARTVTVDVVTSLDVVKINGDLIEALPDGHTDIQAFMRQLPSGAQVGDASTLRGLTLNQPNAGLVIINGMRASNMGRVYVSPTSLDAFYVNRDPNDTRTVDYAEIDIRQVQAVEVLRGPTNRLYGADANQGVISIPLDKDTDYTSGGNAAGGITGNYEIADFRVRLSDNSVVTPTLLNGRPGFEPREIWWDTWPPSHAAGQWNLPVGVSNWWGKDVDLDQWSLTAGANWTIGDIADVGVGLDRCDAYTGPDLSNWTRTLNSDDRQETVTAEVRFSLLCIDILKNQDFILLNDPMGVDRTPGSFSLTAGANFLSRGLNQNPADGTALGFSGTDAGSGVNLTAAYMGVSRLDGSGITFPLGSDDGSGGITPVHVDLSTPGQYSNFDYSVAGLYRVGYRFSDIAKNLTDIEYLTYANDDESPVVTGLSGSTVTAGQPLTVTANISDNLGIHAHYTVVDYGAIQLALESKITWKRGDVALRPAIGINSTGDGVATVEIASDPVFGAGTLHQPVGVWVYTDDLGGQGTDEWIPGTSTGERTVSWTSAGTDGFFWRGGGNVRIDMLNPDNGDDGSAPTQVTEPVSLFTAGSGNSFASEFSIYAEVKWSVNPSISWWTRVADWTSITRIDSQGFFEEQGDVVIDMVKYPLWMGDFNLRAAVRDSDNNILFSSQRPAMLRITELPF